MKLIVEVGFYWRMLTPDLGPPHEIIEVEYDTRNDTQPSKKDVIIKALSQREGSYPRTYSAVIVSGEEYLQKVQIHLPTSVEVSKVINHIVPSVLRSEVFREEGYSTPAPTAYHVKSKKGEDLSSIYFQRGALENNEPNGITNEDLITIVIDRLQSFQKSQFSCRDNALAITHLEDALFRLSNRTREREARGVEGTHTP